MFIKWGFFDENEGKRLKKAVYMSLFLTQMRLIHLKLIFYFYLSLIFFGDQTMHVKGCFKKIRQSAWALPWVFRVFLLLLMYSSTTW